MTRRKSPKDREKENLLNKKKTADRKWDELFTNIQKGNKLDPYYLSQIMDECNWADYALIERNLRYYLEVKL